MENKVNKQGKDCEVDGPIPFTRQSVVMEMKWSPLKKYSVMLLVLLIISISSTVNRLQNYVPHSVRIGSVQHVEAARLAQTQTYVEDETFWCDRSDNRTDICYMRGNVHLIPGNLTSVVLCSTNAEPGRGTEEKIWPYPRKWDNLTLETVSPVVLKIEHVEMNQQSLTDHYAGCDVVHLLPVLVFSAGGFTGNPYHDFNDVIIPVFINSRKYLGEVVFGITDVRDWWLEKFNAFLKLLTKHEIININATDQIHCFREATVGLHVHAELAIVPSLMPHNETIEDLQQLLHQAFGGHDSEETFANSSRDCLLANVNKSSGRSNCRLKMVLFGRKQSRTILNQDQVVKLARGEGFEVEVLEPSGQTGMRTVYRALHDADVMIGVHGAALTHMLFMRPGSVFIQIVPLGTDWPAYTYYQEPAQNRLHLHYLEYRISAAESTLTRTYSADNLAMTDPEAVIAKNWEVRKKMYLEGQDVQLSIPKVLSTLREAKRLALEAFPEKREPF